MNDEIKEILDMLRKYGSTNDKVLLDYITNLQQENERLKEENNKAMNDYAHAIDESWYRELYDYKYRCEKAVEYINKQDMAYYGSVVETKIGIILNILQNESDANEK